MTDRPSLRPVSPIAALLAAALVASVPVGGTLVLRQAASVTFAGVVPATLASTHASIPAPGTAATITGVALPVGGVLTTTVLTLQHGASPWSVTLVATAKSGFSIPDSVVLTLVGPTSSGLTLTSGSAVPASTAAVSMGTTSDLTVTAKGICLGTCSITLEIRLTSTAAGPVPIVVYPVALDVT